MPALFVYGTLMCEEIFEQVTGTIPIARKAILKEFRRFSVKNEHYPGVVGQKGFQVEGLIYDNISEQSWDLLDSFEGDMYFRQEVEVHLENGKRLDAFVYVVKPEYTHLMGTYDWSYDRFMTSGKAQFVGGYSGFRGLGQKGKHDRLE
jgi:gamma-glutamylcyclotransferase (GGCT)/AIG2-like uncharacterized protein YtfP